MNGLAGVKNDGGSSHRPGQWTAPDLIHPGNVPMACCPGRLFKGQIRALPWITAPCPSHALHLVALTL